MSAIASIYQEWTFGPCRSGGFVFISRRCFRFLCFTIVFTLLGLVDCFGAAPSSTNAPAQNSTNITPIASSEIAVQAQATLASLHGTQTEAEADQAVRTIQQQLPSLTEEVGARCDEDSRILSHSTSLELYSHLEGAWQAINDEVVDWNRTLTRRAKQLQDNATHLEQVSKTWQVTSNATAAKLPAELSQRVEAVLSQAKTARDAVESELTSVLKLQGRVTEQQARIHDSMMVIDEARREVLRHLLVRDSPALWSHELWNNKGQDIALQGQHSFARQWKELKKYFSRKAESFYLQAFVFILLVGLLFFAQRQLSHLVGKEEALKETARTIGSPVPSAFVLTVLMSPWIYPQAPRLLWSLLGTVALVPAAFVLRRLLTPPLFGTLNILIALYLLDQVRIVLASQPLLWRLVYLIELAAGCLYCVFRLRSSAYADEKVGNTLRVGTRVALALFVVILLVNIVGYTRLSGFVGNAFLSGAYLAIIIYAGIRIAEALSKVILTISPVARFSLFGRHNLTVVNWVQQTLKWVGIFAWIGYVLEKLTVRRPLLLWAEDAAKTRLSIGSLHFVIGDVFLFVVVVWASFLVSRLARFILDEEVFPHVNLAPGLHYSISKTLHYVILLLGFIIALAIVGYPLTNLAVLAGAVGVGLGFGMQNIVSNFVSGIILLFERPVKVGDVIQMDDAEGIVKRIGIRASIIRTVNGSEVIVPNSKLISEPVTNWTFSQRRRLVIVPVAVGSEAEPQKVMELLKKVGSENGKVSKERPVEALLTNVNDGTTNFELRAWIDNPEDWQQVRSELFVSIKSALAAQKVPIH